MDKYNSIIAKLLNPKSSNGFAITLTKNTTIYSVGKDQISEKWKKHEECHKSQIKIEGIFLFYLKYMYEYVDGRIKGMNHNDAYLSISFEVEARKAEVS